MHGGTLALCEASRRSMSLGGIGKHMLILQATYHFEITSASAATDCYGPVVEKLRAAQLMIATDGHDCYSPAAEQLRPT
eukprot:6482746-Amphidinium_carterae.3